MSLEAFIALAMIIVISLSPITFASTENTSITTKEEVVDFSDLALDEDIFTEEWFVTDYEPLKPEKPLLPTIKPSLPVPDTIPEDEPTQPNKDKVNMDYVIWYDGVRVYKTGEKTTHVANQTVDINFLAKLLFAEAAICNRTGKIYVCSAILNLCDQKNISIWDAGHNQNIFEVAPHVDQMEPTEDIYEIIDYVLNGGRIADICYFRTRKYHNFGIPVCQIENLYFSKE